MRYAVLYGVVLDGDELFFDVVFMGGMVNTLDEAADLARDVTDDKSLPGPVFTKTYPFENSVGEIQSLAHKQFCQMAIELYDVDEMNSRREKRRKSK